MDYEARSVDTTADYDNVPLSILIRADSVTDSDIEKCVRNEKWYEKTLSDVNRMFLNGSFSRKDVLDIELDHYFNNARTPIYCSLRNLSSSDLSTTAYDVLNVAYNDLSNSRLVNYAQYMAMTSLLRIRDIAKDLCNNTRTRDETVKDLITLSSDLYNFIDCVRTDIDAMDNSNEN